MTKVSQLLSDDDAATGMNKLKLSHPTDFSTMEKTQDALEERQEHIETSVKSVQVTQKNLNWYLNDKEAGAQVAAGLKDMAEVQPRTKAVMIQMRDIVQNSQAPGLISTEQKQKDLGKWEKLGQEVEKMLVSLEETPRPAKGEPRPSEATTLRAIRTANPQTEFMVVKIHLSAGTDTFWERLDGRISVCCFEEQDDMKVLE